MFNGQKTHHPNVRFFLYFAERRGPGCCCARADKKVGLLRVTANTTCTKEHSRRLSLRSLPRVSDKVRFIQHGLSRTVSNRPVCIQSLPRRQLARLPTKMSCYSSTLSHIHIYTYTTTYELARLLIVQSLLLYAYGISYCNSGGVSGGCVGVAENEHLALRLGDLEHVLSGKLRHNIQHPLEALWCVRHEH